MVGAVIITHGRVAESLVGAAESIAGKLERVRIMSVKGTDTTEGIREVLAGTVKEVDAGKGVIIFTDMFGGTPTNIALSLLEEDRVEVITGVNLPILLKFVSHRTEKPLAELALFLKEYGRESIVLAGNVLKEKK
ncbi:MAG TPA: PTS sugar transporter subunit IIA [Thermodesulfobacteriota bacterium]|nr:PTS sugar transporter subunit IIA [Thermodesulfobacteriota bacterium]